MEDTCSRVGLLRCAVGDIHGDLRKAISSLEAARVLQEVGGQVRWSGGDTVVVQLGDVLDRGDSEIGKANSAEHSPLHVMQCHKA